MTNAERKRRLYEMGCIACLKGPKLWRETQIHHITHKGHKETIPLCPWHHQGQPVNGLGIHDTRDWLGPSMFHEKKAFIERYGSERLLLAEVNELLGESTLV